MEKKNKKPQPHWALNVLDLHTKMTAWSFASWSGSFYYGYSRWRRWKWWRKHAEDAKVDPDDNDSGSSYPEVSAEDTNKSSTSWGRWCGCGRKMPYSSGCGFARGYGQKVQCANQEQVCDAIILIFDASMWFWQYPLLAPSVCYPQMVWGRMCACACV